MTPQNEAIRIITDILTARLGCKIIIGPLPKDGGITAELTGGGNKDRYLNTLHGKKSLTVLFLCKDKSQERAAEQLYEIQNCLDSLSSVEGSQVFVMSAQSRSCPALVGNDGGYYVYSYIAAVDIIF